MALITCPECGREISDAAQACPNCGFPLARMDVRPAPAVQAAPAQTGETILVVRRGFALAAAILGTVGLILCMLQAIGAAGPWSDFWAETFTNAMAIQAALATVAVVCNWVGFLRKARPLVLTAAVFYTLALAVFIVTGLFYMLLPVIFAYVGHARMRPRRMTVEEYMLD